MNSRFLFSALIMSAKNLWHNKTRTLLTVLGIVIGMATVIIVYSAGEGIYSLVFNQVKAFGTDTVQTETKIPSGKSGNQGDMETASAMAAGVQVTTLTIDDMDAITRSSKNIKQAYAALMSQEQVSRAGELKRAFLYGVSASYLEVDSSKIAVGRWFTENEDKALSTVAILGSKMKDKLFGDSDPIGQSIKIRGERFTVIGVMAERGAVMTLDFDDFVYVPVRTLQKRIMGIDYVSYMMHQLKDTGIAEDTAEEIRQIVRDRHDISDPLRDDFRVTTMIEALSTIKTITGAVTLLLLAIVAISLIVGGVGIMNIMYVVVTERTAEIGLRKALGASYGQIMSQFLLESVMITAIGGVVGVLIGLGVAWLVAWGAQAYGLDWTFSVPSIAYAVAAAFSVVFGLLFGLFPARQAAKLDPIEALRQEN